MKISTKGRYGLTIMIELAKRYGDGPLSLKAIAEIHNLSAQYLEQIAAPLRNAGLIQSIRGAYGGYQLAKNPSEITAGDVIRVLEGPIKLVDGIEKEERAKQALWIRMTEAVKNVLDTTTLEDLKRDSESKPKEEYMFYI